MRYCISLQDVATPSAPSKKVNINISRLRPSRARLKLTPKLGIQLAEKVVIHSEPEDDSAIGSNHISTERIKLTTRQRMDIQRQSVVDHCAAIHASRPPAMRIMINQSKIIWLIFLVHCPWSIVDGTMDHRLWTLMQYQSQRQNQNSADHNPHNVPAHN